MSVPIEEIGVVNIKMVYLMGTNFGKVKKRDKPLAYHINKEKFQLENILGEEKND